MLTFDVHPEEPMNFAAKARGALLALMLAVAVLSAAAQADAQTAPVGARPSQMVRVVGVVRDEVNAIALPGVPVEVVGTGQVAYTDVDGRYILQLPPGMHQMKVVLENYQEKVINVDVGAERTVTVDVGLTMTRFSETITVTGKVIDG
jgi:hypothetical protein